MTEKNDNSLKVPQPYVLMTIKAFCHEIFQLISLSKLTKYYVIVSAL